MTVVLVHGNPETDAIWGPLVDALGRTDVLRLSPPGFGSPLPDDFAATYVAYRDWLEGELQDIGEPIDLVGHDWGGGHVINVVMHRPELVRSWASDILGVFDPDYVWHDLAQVWQTPGDGEQSVLPGRRGELGDPGAEDEPALDVTGEQAVMLQCDGDTVGSRPGQARCLNELSQRGRAALSGGKYANGLIQYADSARVVHVLILPSQHLRCKLKSC